MQEMPKRTRQTVQQNQDTPVDSDQEEFNITGRGNEAPRNSGGREDTENVAPPSDNVELPTPSPVPRFQTEDKQEGIQQEIGDLRSTTA